MYEGFIEMQRIVTRIQYGSPEQHGEDAYRRIEFGIERLQPEPEGVVLTEERPFESPRSHRWWKFIQ